MLPRGHFTTRGEVLTGVLAEIRVSCGWTFQMWGAVLRTKGRRRGPCCWMLRFLSLSLSFLYYYYCYYYYYYYVRENNMGDADDGTTMWGRTTWEEHTQESGVGGLWNSFKQKLYMWMVYGQIIVPSSGLFRTIKANSWIKFIMKSFYLTLSIC